MSDGMRKVLESKQQMRKHLTALPFSEKIKLLEKLRDRSLAIASNPLRQPPHSRPCAPANDALRVTACLTDEPFRLRPMP